MYKYLSILFLTLIFNLNAQFSFSKFTKSDGGREDEEEEEIYNFDSETDFDKIEIVDSLNHIRIFTAGENHYFRVENSHLELNFLKYLNKKHNVRNLIIELGFSRGYMLNQYINGDTSYFDLMKNTTSNIFLYYYKKMKDWNMELPVDKRITIHGVDIERFSSDGVIMISKLLPNYKKVPKEIELAVEAIHSISNSFLKDVEKYSSSYSSIIYQPDYNRTFNQNTIDSFIQSFEKYKPQYKEITKEKFDLLEKVVKSMKEYLYWVDNKTSAYSAIVRERTFYKNIRSLLDKDSTSKFYGQFGRCHISLKLNNTECQTFDYSSVMTRFVEDSLGHLVASFGIYYASGKTKSNSSSNSYYTPTYSFYSKNHQYERYHQNTCKGNNVFYKVADDDTILNKLYNYIIINDVCDRRSPGYYEISKKYKKVKNLEYYQSFGYQYQLHNFNFNNFNRLYFNDSFSFSNQVPAHYFEYTYSDKMFYSFGFGFFSKQKINQTYQTSELKGRIFNTRMGYDWAVTKRFNTLFFVGYSYQNLFILRNMISSLPFPLNINKNTSTKIVNNGSIFNLGLDFRIALGKLFLEAGYNYNIDLSNKKWSVDKKPIENSPNFSHTYSLFKFGIGFYWY